jgi:hypothetical protein
MWGAAMGIGVGGAVVIVSSMRFGLSAPLALLGMVLAIAFGGLACVGAFVTGRTHVD